MGAARRNFVLTMTGSVAVGLGRPDKALGIRPMLSAAIGAQLTPLFQLGSAAEQLWLVAACTQEMPKPTPEPMVHALAVFGGATLRLGTGRLVVLTLESLDSIMTDLMIKPRFMRPKVAAQAVRDVQSPGHKAQRTARWARIMTKWLITRAGRAGVKWQFAEFGGVTGSESAGIVDILAVRKNHKVHNDEFRRGDLLDIVLIQTKGGTARKPSDSDIKRLIAVKEYHNARAVVLAEWKFRKGLQLSQLIGEGWQPIAASDIFR